MDFLGLPTLLYSNRLNLSSHTSCHNYVPKTPLINSFKQNIEVGRKGSPSFISNFLWQFSLKITRTVLFRQLSGNSMQDSFSFSPCSKETAPLEMFEHWCILVQLWEKGRFFSTCVCLAKTSLINT